ncbi:FecR family protein [Herbaspirillum rubrisubalbicans]|nr:FecR domain-containing protein [Herbaspirillum rubrisubalbicans]
MLLASVLLLAWGEVAAQESTASLAAIVKVLHGDVQTQRGGKMQPLGIGTRLYAGDRVVTGAASSVGFTLRDDTLISLGPNSQFQLEQFAYNDTTDEGNIAVRLTKGTLRYVSGLIGKHAPQRQQLATPTATIGIRGTDFIVEVGDE